MLASLKFCFAIKITSPCVIFAVDQVAIDEGIARCNFPFDSRNAWPLLWNIFLCDFIIQTGNMSLSMFIIINVHSKRFYTGDLLIRVTIDFDLLFDLPRIFVFVLFCFYGIVLFLCCCFSVFVVVNTVKWFFLICRNSLLILSHVDAFSSPWSSSQDYRYSIFTHTWDHRCKQETAGDLI